MRSDTHSNACPVLTALKPILKQSHIMLKKLDIALDSTNLAILRAIADKQDITTREIENIIYLSRSQVLRRLKQLEEQGLIVKRNGLPGKAYHYTLSSDVTPQDIEQFAGAKFSTNRDPVVREALEILLQGMVALRDQLAELARRIDSILK